MNPHPVFINGEPVITRDVVKVRNPYNNALLARICLAGTDEIAAALDVAEKTFVSVRHTSPTERSELLRHISEEIGRRAQDFVGLLISEAGKPMTLAKAEVQRAQATFSLSAAAALHFGDAPLDMSATAAGAGHRGSVRHFPLGIILGITPFNFPLNLVAHKIAPCLATGNTMILKPSPKAPLCALLLSEILTTCGVPPGQITVLPFDPQHTKLLLEDPRVKMLTFTGSDTVGWKLKGDAVKQKSTLELGGNAACIIEPDADWKTHIPKIISGAFSYAGQSCISVQRIFAQRSIYTDFRAAFLAQIPTFAPAGDPSNPKTLVGPMIDSAAVARVQRWIQEAVDAGAHLLTPLKIEGRIMHPVVLEHVPHHAPIMREEAFAPLVILESYDTFAEGLAAANDSRFGLQAGVFTGDSDKILQAYNTLDVGGVLINQVPTFRVENMPYGGMKDSGFGREGIRYSMKEMSELKSLIINEQPH